MAFRKDLPALTLPKMSTAAGIGEGVATLKKTMAATTSPKLLGIQNNEFDERDDLLISAISTSLKSNNNNKRRSHNSNNSSSHDATINARLKPVTAVKITNSPKFVANNLPPQQTTDPISDDNNNDLTSTSPTNKQKPNDDYLWPTPIYNVRSSKHFVELDGLGAGQRNSTSPPPYITSVTPKMQGIVWGSGGFPARLKPVRVNRLQQQQMHQHQLQANNSNKVPHSPPEVRPLEPKLFDFSMPSDRQLHSHARDSITESLIDELEDDDALSALQVSDDADSLTMVGSRGSFSKNYDILDESSRDFAPDNDDVLEPAAEKAQSLADIGMLSRMKTTGSVTNGRISHQTLRVFPPVAAMPVIPPLGHQLNDSSTPPRPGGLPRLPPLSPTAGMPPSVLIRKETNKNNKLQNIKSNNSNAKSLPTFIVGADGNDFSKVSLIGTKAVGSSSNNGSPLGTRGAKGGGGGGSRMLSASFGGTELSSMFDREVRKEKKSAMYP